MSLVLGLDPGTTHSALVGFNGVIVTRHRTALNETLLVDDLAVSADAVLVIEQVEGFGMAVGKEVFETVFWTGRFAQAWPGRFDRLPRRIVKQHLCHTARATDANIRQALIDRFGPGTEKAIGRKSQPGPLFGIKAHEWSALAVAITWYDQNAHLSEELRPGVRAEF